MGGAVRGKDDHRSFCPCKFGILGALLKKGALPNPNKHRDDDYDRGDRHAPTDANPASLCLLPERFVESQELSVARWHLPE